MWNKATADPGVSVKSGPRKNFVNIRKWSQMSQVSPYWMGSWTLRWTLETLTFFTVKCTRDIGLAREASAILISKYVSFLRTFVEN